MEENTQVEAGADVRVWIQSGRMASEQHHRHDVCQLFLFFSGKADYEVGNRYYPLERGNLLLLCPEELHRLHTYGGELQEWTSVVISLPYLEWLSSEKTNLKDCFYKPEQSLKRLTVLSEQQVKEFMMLVRRLKACLEQEEFGSDLMAGCCVTELVLMAERVMRKNHLHPEKPMPLLVQQTIQYVNEHIQEPIQIETLSRDLYHNRSHVSRMFKEYVGISLQQYIINQRLSVVMRALQEGKSLVEASEEAGFNNYSNFIRTFTKHVGISPHRYQRQVKDKSGRA